MSLENLHNMKLKEHAHLQSMSQRGHQNRNTKKNFEITKMEIQHTKNHKQIYRYVYSENKDIK